MSQRYLVALDGTAFAEQALGYALALLKPHDELIMARVADPQRCERSLAEGYLRRVLARLGPELPVVPRTVVVYGEPEVELARLAETEEASLLVLSTHRRTGWTRLLLGSVAESVARQAPCPVWLVPAQEHAWQLLEEPWHEEARGPLGTLLIPLDTSELADRALEFVRRWPPAQWARLVLLAATDERTSDRGLNSKLRSELHHSLEERALSLRRCGWGVVTRVEDDLAYEAIARVAKSEFVDAVVMATHGRSGVDRYLNGSLAERVARECGCPAILVPPRASVSAGRTWPGTRG